MSEKIKKRKIMLVGTGFVGMSFAYSMLSEKGIDELVLVDVNEDKARGEQMDLSDGLVYADTKMKITAGTYADATDTNIVVLTAGAAQKPGQTRLDLVKINANITKGVCQALKENNFNGILVVANNPVDIMTYVAYKVSGLPANQIIGSGTLLDSARLQCHIADCIDVDTKSIHAYVLGEHGDSEMIPWSTVRVGGKDIYQIIKDNPTRMNEGMFDSIHEAVKKDGWEIFNRKGNTCYGIAASTTRIVRALMFNESVVLPVSTYLDGQYGQDGVFTSVPAILDATGVKEVVEIEMTKEEKEQFDSSCSHLQSFYKEV